MVNTAVSETALLGLFDNNTSGDISANDIRDFVVSTLGLCKPQSDPTPQSGCGILYTKTVNSIVELFYRDDSSTTIQITLNGRLNVGQYIYIKAVSQSEGNLNLSDGTNWNTTTSVIKGIMVETNSANWNLTLYPDSDFDSEGIFPPITLVSGASGDKILMLDLPYKDTDDTTPTEVHINYTDVIGTDTANIYIWGVTA